MILLIFTKKNDTLNINYSSYADNVKIFRKVNSVNIKIGYQYIKNHFVIDFGIGLGKRIETIKHEQRLNEEDVYIGNWGLFYPLTYKKKGQIQALNMPITFKLGYSF